MCYYVPADDLIVNALIAKSSAEDKPVQEVKTNVSELVTLSNYAFKKLDGDCVFEVSSKDILATLQLYPNRFIYQEKSKDIMYNCHVDIKNNELEELFSLPEKITEIFNQFFQRLAKRYNESQNYS